MRFDQLLVVLVELDPLVEVVEAVEVGEEVELLLVGSPLSPWASRSSMMRLRVDLLLDVDRHDTARPGRRRSCSSLPFQTSCGSSDGSRG